MKKSPKLKCQVCQSRNAVKELHWNAEEFFLVCGKDKCSDQIKSALASNQNIQEFKDKIKHNPGDYQGRSYEKVSSQSKVLFYVFSAALSAIVIYSFYRLIQALSL